jgi:transposase
MIARRSASDIFGIGGVVPFCDAVSCSTDCILIKGCPTNDPSVLDSSARPRSDRVRESTYTPTLGLLILTRRAINSATMSGASSTRCSEVDDRRVLNGIFWVLGSGASWRDLPETYGPRTTCNNRFVRWRRAGVWDQVMDTLVAGHDAAVQMIDTSVVRVIHRISVANPGRP